MVHGDYHTCKSHCMLCCLGITRPDFQEVQGSTEGIDATYKNKKI